MKTTKQLREGINGSGNRVWIVQTLNEIGSCIGSESFDTESEALAWIKYA